MAIINGTAVANTLNGTAGNDTINGLGGNDTLNGNAGNDILDGGTGADKMKGNAGNDTYVVDSTGDLVTELASQGTDLVKASITYTLGLNVENLTLTGAGHINGTGNTLNNVITGNTGNNILSGSSGNDTLNGGTGNDTLDGGVGNDILDGGTGSDKMTGGTGNDTIKVDSTGDTVTELASGGTDVVQTGLDYSLAALVNVENLTLTGTAAVDGTGNLGNNIITGNSNANVLNGRAGNDTLHGNGGEDVLLGLAGNDTLNGGDGNDELLGSAGDDILNGGADDDLLTGGIGNDTLDGGAGADLLIGHGGDDTLVWDANDLIIQGGTGNDTLKLNGAGQTLDLTATPFGRIQNIEIVDLTGTGNNTLNLDVLHVVPLSFSTDTLRVDGNAGDQIVTSEHWTYGGTTVINTLTYHIATNGGATLHVRDGIDFVSPNDAPTGTPTATPENGTEDTDYLVIEADLLEGFTDPEGDPLSVENLTADHGTLQDNGDGTWTFTPDEEYSGPVTLNYDVEDAFGASTGATQSFELDPVADAPELTALDATGLENNEIPLSISSNLTDASETLSIVISGVPAGATFSTGIDNGDGSWTFTAEELSDLTITPPADSVDPFDLTVTATSTDGGDTAEASQTIHVTVVADEEELPAVEGTGFDGYIVGATVFADANGNGVLDAGEAWTTTGGSGQFTLVGGTGPLVMFGGTDISTGLPFQGTMKATAGSTVITPLTTLIAELVSSGAAPDAATAESQVETALGLTGVDLTTFDPIAAALDGDAGNDAAALSVFAAGVQVQNAIVLAASLISGTGDATLEDATAAVITALADTIDSAGTIDLASAAEMETLVGDAATEAGADIGTTASGAGAIIAATNTVIDAAIDTPATNLDALTDVAQAAIVAQDTDTGAAAALTEAGGTGDTTTAQDSFTGANLDTAVAAAVDDVGAVEGAENGTSGNDVLSGSEFGDVLDALAGNDTVDGAEGNDLLFGGTGRDTLNGEDGDDQLFGGAGDDILTGALGNDLLDGGENPANQLFDQDTANYAINDGIVGATGVTVNLAAGTASDGLGGTDTLVNIERVNGTDFDDLLTGGDPTNLGTNRAEIFEGRGGNDMITGGSDLQNGSYLATYSHAEDSVLVNLGTSNVVHGSTTILAGTAQDGDGGLDTLANINRIHGSSNDDVIYGRDNSALNVGVERLQGMAGNDYINGGAGVDYVHYQHSTGAVTVTFSNSTFGSGTADDGYGTLDTFDNIEGVRGGAFNDVLTGSNRNEGLPNGGSVERFEGMAGNDIITGNGGADRIEFFQSPTGVIVNLSGSTAPVGQIIIGPNSAFDGFGGTDTLSGIEQVTGSRFSDTIIGPNGTGNNRFDGGLGSDTVSYRAASSSVTVDLNQVNVGQVTGGAGTDTLLNVENLAGSSFNDTLIGDANANRLNGRGGNDTLTGGAGNDVLDGGENSNNVFADADRINYDVAGVLTGVNVNLATGVTTNDGFGGTDTLISIERVTGTAFNDILTGGDALNVGTGVSEQFEGLEGNDVITGGDIADGFTTFALYTNSENGVRVNIGDGSVDLADYGESGILEAGTAWDGFQVEGEPEGVFYVDTLIEINRVRGSAFDDMLFGGDVVTGVERFEGMAGNDFIDGGAGIDILHYQTGTTHGISVTLGATGSGTVADDGFTVAGQDEFENIEGVRGTNFNDVLTGSGRVDVIERFEGMAGNDTITGGGGLDRVEYGQSTNGVNVNLATNTASDGFGNTDTLSGIEQVTGSRFNDALTGNGGDNLLNGSGGNDTLIGGAGDDVLNGGENLESQLADTDAVNYNASGVLNGVVVDLSAGTASNDGFGDSDTLSNIERVFGTHFDDVLTGGDTANINTGKSEQFEGRAGDDVITGGDIDLGFTTFAMYTNDTSGIKVNLDTVTHTLGGIEVLAGKAHDGFGDIDTLVDINRIRGSAHDDFMIGGASTTGNQRFEGLAGDDWIDGGADIDYLMFQSGNPTTGVTVDLGADGFDFGSGIVANDGFGTTDTFFGIEGVRGSIHADTLIGSNRGDEIEFFEGMQGNDEIIGFGGLDRVEYGQSENGINVNLALGTALDGFGGVDTLSGIEQVRGSRVNDTITGDGGANRLDGNDGVDRIAGGAGDDTLIGGLDADTFDWNAGDQGTGVSPAVDTVTDFNLGDEDKLDLRDLLVGENAFNLGDYLDFSLVGSDTLIDVRSTGAAGDVDQQIVLEGIDYTLLGATEADVLAGLLLSGTLVVDQV